MLPAKTKIQLISLLCLTIGLFSSCQKEENLLTKIPPGAVAFYQLNGNALDETMNKLDGEIIESVQPVEDRHGQANSAMYFSGKRSFIEVDEEKLRIKDSIAISVWVKADSIYDAWSSIVTRWDARGFGTGFYLGINPDGFKLRWRVEEDALEMEESFPMNEWKHIVAMYNGKYLRLFVDGIQVGELESNEKLYSASYPFTIGNQSRWSSRANFDGAIDDVIVYSRSLSVEEIHSLYTLD